MSRHIKGQSRTQTTLFPEAIDDFVTEDNPIRVIDLFVDQLDLLELGFEAVNAKQLELFLVVNMRIILRTGNPN
jgi:hypothetical protein